MRRNLGIVAFFVLMVILVGCAAPAAAPTSAPAASGASSAPAAMGAPIILGVPTDLGTIEGGDSLRSVQMAVEEINSKGGVNVGGTKRPFAVESIDTREADANIPVNDAV